MNALWLHRWLLVAMVGREVRSRYIGSLGGLLWALLQPLVLLGIYALVFRSIFKVDLPALGSHTFVEFVAIGLWPWLAFQEGVQRATQAVSSNSHLVRKVAFPHEFLVLASLTSTFAIHMAGYMLVLGVLAIFGGGLHAFGVLALVAVLPVLFLMALGIGLMVSAAQVFLRDVEQVIQPLMMVGFYATPILYSADMLPDWLARAMALNPLAHLVGVLREGLFAGAVSGWFPLLLITVGTMLFLAAAFAFFKRLSPHFEDFL